MWTKTAGVFSFPILILALWPISAIPSQETQKAPPTVKQFGVSVAPAKPAPIPPGSQQPDRLLHPGSASTITSLAFSPDGGWLASGGYDNSIIIWNATTGAEQTRLTWPRSPNDPLTKLEFSPDGNRLASYTSNGEVKIWDYRNGHNVYSLHLRGLSVFTYSPDGKVWAASTVGPKKGSTARIEIHDAATGKPVRAIPTKWYAVTGMTITREGLLIGAGSTTEDSGDENNSKGTVQVWDVPSGELAKSSAEFAAVGPLSPDGRFMANIDSSEQGKARILVTDLSNNQVKWTFQQQAAASVFFSPDSKDIAVTNEGSAQGLNVWSLVSGASVSNIHEVMDPSQPVALTTVAFSPDGRWIAAPDSPAYSVKVWDVAAGREVRAFCGHRSVLAVAISPDGRWLASAGAGVAILDPATGKIITTLTSDAADRVVFSSDGRWVAANSGRGAALGLKVWDTKNWSLVGAITPERDPRKNRPVQWIAFGGSQSPPAKLGEAQSMQFTVDGATRAVWFGVSPLALSPNGRLLVQQGMPMNNVEVWDASSGQKLMTFAAHKMVTNSLAFSGDGRWLLTVGQESQRMAVDPRTFTGTTEFRLKLWDVATWKEGEWVSFPRISPGTVVFLPEGRGLAVQMSGEVIELLDMDHQKSLGTLAATDPQPGYFPSFNGGNLAMNSDGTLLFQGAKNGIRIWNVPRP